MLKVFEPVDSMSQTGKMLDIIAKRQNALGDNLSNVDTPGYVRKDVNFSQYLASSGPTRLENKLEEKFGPSPTFNDEVGGVVNSANEIMELQKNSLIYTVATRRMSNIITQMKTVVNVGK